MESTEVKGICLICLKRFDLSSSEKNDIRYEPRCLTAGAGFEPSPVAEEVGPDPFKRSFDDIYTRFLHMSCRYLKLTSTAEVFLMAATSYKSDTGKFLQAFCEDCRYLVSYVCDLYAELQALKMHLVSKLALIEEVMEDRKKFMPFMLRNRLAMELKEQLRVKSRMRVDAFRMAFHQKCKSKVKNDAPKVLVPRGLLPEEWKFGYSACKLTLMRLITIFALASSKVLPSNEIGSTRNDLRPQMAQRGKGRPKCRSILKANNENAGPLLENTDNQNQDDLENNSSNFSHGAPSPISMEASVAGSDDDFNPDFQIEEDEETTAVLPEKRWNLRQRKREVIVLTQESDSSDHSDIDYEKSFEKPKKSESKYPNEPPKNLRGWPRVGDCEPSIPCTKCGKMFLDKRSLATHSVYVHNIHNSYPCAYCGQTFIRWKDRQNHRKKVHPIKRTNYTRRHPKEAKPKKPKKPTKLKTAKKVERERKPPGRPRKPDAITRKCQKCDQYFPTITDLQKHKLEVHLKDKQNTEGKSKVKSKKPKVRKHKCKKCDLSFTTIEDFRQHRQEVHLNDKYSKDPRERKCLKCPEVFMTFKEWRRHKIKVHGRQGEDKSGLVYTCQHCPGLTFPTWTLNRQHRRKFHPFNAYGKPPVGPTKCLDCEKHFPTGQEMMEHRKAEHRYKYVQYFVLASGEFQCKKCEDTFATKELVMEHRKISHHTEYTKHECPICYHTIQSPGRFKAHLKRHEFIKPRKAQIATAENWFCEVCSKHFHWPASLKHHMTKVHQDKYSCYICNASLETGKLLRDHLVEHEKPEKFFHCMVCFQGFSNLQYYDLHRKITHTEHRRFHCDYNYCNEIVDTMEQLSLHMETHLQDGRTEDTSTEWKDIHKCDVCDKPFIKKYNFTIHSLTHTELNKKEDTPGYDCPLCEHTVKNTDSLISHYNRMHGLNIKPCKCYICEKEFYRRGSYDAHSRECEYTQAEENLVCNFCGVKFDDKESLQGHKNAVHYAIERQRFRTEVKVCPEEGCGETRTSAQMVLHLLRAHGKGDKYPCEKCGKCFVDKWRLNDHLKEFHGEGDHKCPTCGKGFGKPSQLKRHEFRKHTENRTKSHCCHLCGMSYYSNSGLMFHNWSAHKDVYSKELKHKCPHCGKLYGRRHLLTSHVKNCKANSDKSGDSKDKGPRKKATRRKNKVEDDEEMTDKSTTEDEDTEDNQKPPALSQVAPVLYPRQMVQAVPSLSSATMPYQQWLNTTAAAGLGGNDIQQQNFMAAFFQRTTQEAEEMHSEQSQSTSQSAESLHQL